MEGLKACDGLGPLSAQEFMIIGLEAYGLEAS